MSNQPNYRKVVNFNEWRDRRIEEATICVELSEGDPILIPPPEMWPDDLPKGRVAMISAIIGEQELERFRAAGGSAKQLDAIFTEATEDLQGTDPGK